MDYADNEDLYQKIVEHQKKGQLFSEIEIWNIFIQVYTLSLHLVNLKHTQCVKGLKALHDLKIFHRDMKVIFQAKYLISWGLSAKSANVFLNKDGLVKLGDLNVSKVAKKGLLFTQTGTPYYAR